MDKNSPKNSLVQSLNAWLLSHLVRQRQGWERQIVRSLRSRHRRCGGAQACQDPLELGPSPHPIRNYILACYRIINICPRIGEDPHVHPLYISQKMRSIFTNKNTQFRLRPRNLLIRYKILVQSYKKSLEASWELQKLLSNSKELPHLQLPRLLPAPRLAKGLEASSHQNRC